VDRIDYIALLDRALGSWNGIRLDYGDDRTARRVRAKLYHIRDEIRAEARSEPPTSPAITYDTNGQLLGVIEILNRRRQRTRPSTPYDRLRMRVWDGSLYIVPVTEQPRRVDELQLPEAHDVEDDELAELPHWPPWSA
jgi:hypothetical protein